MLNLIRLELMKFKLWPVIKSALIAICILSICITLILWDEAGVNGYNQAFAIIDTFSRAVFMIFGASLIAKFIIQEFQEKTMTVMFMYPINRKKMMFAKMFIIIFFTFCSIMISDIVVSGAVYVFNLYHPIITGTLTVSILLQNALKLFMNALAATGISFIPIYFGMKKYSVRTTVVSAIVIVALLNLGRGTEGTLFNFVAIPVTLACMGLFIAYMAIRKIEQVDLFK
ncbi:ABC transporter permease [Bacillus pseudomycoides]|uniref:ABC transporter permease n=1 Tax=Bacillus pseudomycoides TaxID=64104 RepID=UPI000BEDAB4F|nr:ABC transporter permease [Bacillus pseudomycoides]PDY45721.1 ABC transporter permease [Bacillus pseudomycoides]PEA82836.1 ABC transporter permease [Bacillus pseudomycoides]PFZ14270.1 ABC transporter permease [Bacillus pseudomycoides]PHB20348.1 ABC transporter permease [Bacillus pseudomycoides]PHB47660.1 ABC transporter permease [Bacillus pseudomycoides]